MAPLMGQGVTQVNHFLGFFFIIVLYFRSILMYLAFPGFLPFLPHFGDAS